MDTEKEQPVSVLLVDDEQELVEYLSKRLLRAGFTVRAVNSGAEAVDEARSGDYDVAVVDLKMPGMDGIETQRQLKQVRPFLKTIVLTGHGSIDAALESGRQDAFRFMAKPAPHEELMAAIQEAARLKRDEQTVAFRRELEEISASGGRPREMVERVEAVWRKYGVKR